MMRLILLFQVLGLFNLICAKESKYLSNFKPGTDFTTVGPESVVTDYVTIANDPLSNLPNAFTICSSLFIEVFTTVQNMIQMYNENGTHWFHFGLDVERDFGTRSETVILCYQTGKYFLGSNKNSKLKMHLSFLEESEELLNFDSVRVPIVPHSWYHIIIINNIIIIIILVPHLPGPGHGIWAPQDHH